MTKAVRIENADTNTSVKVVVIVEDQGTDGEWREVDRRELGHPTAMAHDLYLTTSRRLVVQEVPAG